MQYLKQSTAATIMFGPFVDKADGVTLKTDATTITDIDHATTGIFLSKEGGTAAVRHQTVTASVADAYGMMKVTLDTTDTGTVGRLRVLFAKAATYLPVDAAFCVLPANVYDSMMGTDLLDVNQAQVLGTAVHASTEAGTQCVEVVRWGGNDIAATAINGTPKVDIAGYRGTASHTETTAGLIPAELHQVLGQAVTCAGGVTILANVGFAGAPGAASGALTTDGTSMNQLLKQGTHASVVIPTVTTVGTLTTYTGNTLQTGNVATLITTVGAAGAGLTALPTVATVTNLTNLPAVTTDWLTAAGVKADAVTKIQAGLATPTNITAGTLTTATNLTNLPAIPANWITAAGVNAAALNGKGDWSTTTPPAVAAIADAVWDEAIAGHLTGGTTGVSLNGAGSAGDPWTTALPGAYGAGTAGRLIGRSLPDVVAGGNGGLPTTNGTKLSQTVDLTASQSIACSDKTGFSLSSTGADLILKSSTFVQAIVAAVNEFATYGLTALNTLLVTTGIKAATVPAVTLANGAHGGAAATLTLSGAAGLVATKIDAPINGALTGNITGNLSGTVGKSPATLAAADVSGNLPVDVKKVNGTTVNGDGHTGTEWGP